MKILDFISSLKTKNKRTVIIGSLIIGAIVIITWAIVSIKAESLQIIGL